MWARALTASLNWVAVVEEEMCTLTQVKCNISLRIAREFRKILMSIGSKGSPIRWFLEGSHCHLIKMEDLWCQGRKSEKRQYSSCLKWIPSNKRYNKYSLCNQLPFLDRKNRLLLFRIILSIMLSVRARLMEICRINKSNSNLPAAANTILLPKELLLEFLNRMCLIRVMRRGSVLSLIQ